MLRAVNRLFFGACLPVPLPRRAPSLFRAIRALDQRCLHASPPPFVPSIALPPHRTALCCCRCARGYACALLGRTARTLHLHLNLPPAAALFVALFVVVIGCIWLDARRR